MDRSRSSGTDARTGNLALKRVGLAAAGGLVAVAGAWVLVSAQAEPEAPVTATTAPERVVLMPAVPDTSALLPPVDADIDDDPDAFGRPPPRYAYVEEAAVHEFDPRIAAWVGTRADGTRPVWLARAHGISLDGVALSEVGYLQPGEEVVAVTDLGVVVMGLTTGTRTLQAP